MPVPKKGRRVAHDKHLQRLENVVRVFNDGELPEEPAKPKPVRPEPVKPEPVKPEPVPLTKETLVIPFFKKQTVSVLEGAITPEGERLIKDYVSQFVGIKWHQESSIEWVWMTRRGTLAKRIASMLHKGQNNYAEARGPYDLTPEQIARIGDIAFAHTNKKADYVFDFDSEIRWRAGEFGDGVSCILKGADVDTYKIPSMVKAGVFGMRFYDQNGEGFGRAWVLPFKDGYMVMNGYGLSTQEIGAVFARWVNQVSGIENSWDSKRMRIEIGGTGRGFFYVNNDTSCYACAPKELLDKLDYGIPINFKINKVFAGGLFECQCCRVTRKVKVDGQFIKGGAVLTEICKDCTGQFIPCDHCQKMIHYREKYGDGEGKNYCSDCYKLYFVETACCGAFRSKKQVLYLKHVPEVGEIVEERYDAICEGCAPDILRCVSCHILLNKRHHDTFTATVKNQSLTCLCQTCYRNAALFKILEVAGVAREHYNWIQSFLAYKNLDYILPVDKEKAFELTKTIFHNGNYEFIFTPEQYEIVKINKADLLKENPLDKPVEKPADNPAHQVQQLFVEAPLAEQPPPVPLLNELRLYNRAWLDLLLRRAEEERARAAMPLARENAEPENNEPEGDAHNDELGDGDLLDDIIEDHDEDFPDRELEF